jgi:flagellar basal-body rod protein FlgC
MNTLTSAMRSSASGLTAERFRMDVISSNIANANSIGINGKEPYRRREVVLEGSPNGVKIVAIMPDRSPLRTVHDPSHPNADADGVVHYSNVEPIFEMVNMLTAARAYEANIASFNSAKGMIRSALTIGKV